MDVTLDTSTELVPGHIVKIDVNLPDSSHVALLVFGVPLAFALIGGWLGLSFSDYFGILSGAFGLATGFGVVWSIEHYTCLLRPTVKLMENS